MALEGDMARGKHGARKLNRDAERLARQLEEARAELASAVGLAAATPFWLPPGQTAGYVDSEPLSEADRADVRLPFPQVLVALADPIHLPATSASTTTSDLDHALRELDHGVVAQQRSHAEDNPTLFEVVREVVDTEVWEKQPHLADVIAARGALVEGVLRWVTRWASRVTCSRGAWPSPR
jgi:hypothetical protein